MDIFNNEKLIKAMAFEKAVIEVLKKDNPQLKENYSPYEKFDGKTRLYHQYDAVIFNTLKLKCRYDMQRIVKNILQLEHPLSEEWLLKRIVHFFHREKVTSVVREEFDDRMWGCEQVGIIRKNNFIYLKGKEIPMLRVPHENATVVREVKYISLEELSLGMKEILKQNITVEKSGLFRLLVQQLGFSRMGDAILDRLEDALRLISKEIDVNGDVLSLKQ